jgi:uncharacterized protein
MAVAIVKRAAPADPKTYAHELFNKWKVGKKGKDNGLLILLAMEERRVEIEVGYGLEGVINDAKAGSILDRYVIPYFKQGQFGEGLYNGAAALAAEIAKEAKVELGESFQAKEQVKDKNEGDDPWITFAVTILILLMMFAQGLFFGLIGATVGGALGFALGGVLAAVVGAVLGFVVSYFSFGRGKWTGWAGGNWGGGTWGGGSWSSGGGGGFGGFGGGGSGGGGAGRSW